MGFGGSLAGFQYWFPNGNSSHKNVQRLQMFLWHIRKIGLLKKNLNMDINQITVIKTKQNNTLKNNTYFQVYVGFMGISRKPYTRFTFQVKIVKHKRAIRSKNFLLSYT